MYKLCYHFVFTVFFALFLSQAQAQSTAISATPEDEEINAPATLIAVAAEAATEHAEIHSEINQAPHFLWFDHEGTFLSSQPLPENTRGNSEALAAFLLQRQVTVLIAAHFDNQDLHSLTAYDIIPIERQGVALDEVMRLLQCEPHPPADIAVKADVENSLEGNLAVGEDAHTQTAPAAAQ